MDKRFGLILLAVVAIIGGVFFFTRDSNSTTSSTTGVVSSHISGAGTTGVTLIEFGDFECSACANYYPIVEQIREDYGDKIKFQFINFPLVAIHKNAMAAHRAAEAASLQGKFFEMYDLLYENQRSWASLSSPVSLFEGYAKSLSLDLTKYKADFSSEVVNDTINADVALGKSTYKANSTPTFVLDGKVLNSSEVGSYELFSKKIDEAIAASTTNP